MSKAAKDRAERSTTRWRHPLTGETHRLTIKHTRNYLGAGQDHIEILSTVKDEPHPLSETGYRSEFVASLELINAGGVVAFVDQLVARAIADKTWLKRETTRQQGDLFQWAAAQAETARRRPAKKSRRPKNAARRGGPKNRAP